MASAHREYIESLEEDMDEAINSGPKARYAMPAAVQRIFRLKAEAPEKYREEVKVVNVEAPVRMMEMLREMAIKERERELQEPPAVDGEYREVGGKNES